jgi:hypothetical protein
MLKYLHDYEHKLGLNVMHNVEAMNITKIPDESEGQGQGRRSSQFMMHDQHGNIYECK